MARITSAVSPAEGKALLAAAKAKRQGTTTEAPTITAEELEAFRAYQKAQAEEAARKSIGVQGFEAEPGDVEGTHSFVIVGAMPSKPNEKGAYLNDNSKVVIGGKAYTLLVSLFPYNGKSDVARLRAMGDVVGSL